MHALDLASFEARAHEAESRLSALEAMTMNTKSGPVESVAPPSELLALKESLLQAREAITKVYQERDAAMHETSKLKNQISHLKRAVMEGDQKLGTRDTVLAPIEKAAALIHVEWMKRNPKADWNGAQHVPYDQLPEAEKQKDRDHVSTILSLLVAAGSGGRDSIVDHFAAMAHDNWKKGLAASGHVGPRMKKAEDGTPVDINVPWSELHPDWKKENLAAGSSAYDAVQAAFAIEPDN